MALTLRDREILQDCLEGHPEGWQAFVDQFLGLIVHVVKDAAQKLGVELQKSQLDDLVGEVFLRLLTNKMAILRRYNGGSSLPTYLAVVCRRIAIKQILVQRSKIVVADHDVESLASADDESFLMQNREHVQQALDKLGGMEAQAVRMFHFHGQSYRDIAQHFGVPENSVGPLLSQARARLKRLLA